jgi:ferredoxin
VIDSIFIRCERIVRSFAIKLLSGKKVYRGLFSLPVDLLISPIAFGYYVAGRFFLSKTFIANYNCTNCGLCIRECPTASILLVNNRPYWKLSCESCMRCLNHCPEKAIEAAHGMAVGFWLVITVVNAQIIFLLIRLFNIQPEAIWLKIFAQIISLVCTVFIPAALYIIVHYAMAFKPVKYLVRFTSLTALPFWKRYFPGRKRS